MLQLGVVGGLGLTADVVADFWLDHVGGWVDNKAVDRRMNFER